MTLKLKYGGKEIIDWSERTWWITGFNPSENAKYAITVLVEGTETESKSAIPIFKEICKKINKEYF